MGIEDRDYFRQDHVRRAALGGDAKRQGAPAAPRPARMRGEGRGSDVKSLVIWVLLGAVVFLGVLLLRR
jgi:hypothetical protein